MARRRKKSRSGLYGIFVLIFSTITLVINLVVQFIRFVVRIFKSNSNINASATEKGMFAEEKINSLIGKYLQNKEGRLFADIIIGDDAQSAQIDHLVVTSNCLFVIETKNYRGEIRADTRENTWFIFRKPKSIEFQNPFKQNDLHIQRVRELITESSEFDIYNIVCFYENEGLNIKNILQKNEEYILTTSTTLIKTIDSIFKSYNNFDKKGSNISSIKDSIRLNNFIKALDDVIVTDKVEIENHVRRLKLKEVKKNR